MASYTPSLEQVKELAKQGNLIPIYRDILADLETPVSAYLKVARGDYSFLLESVEGGERLARFSFIGTDPYLVLREDGGCDPLIDVENELSKYTLVALPGLPRFHGGAVGYLAYDGVRHFERLTMPEDDPLGLPEGVFMFNDTLLVFDHLHHKIRVISHVHVQSDVENAYDEAIAKIERLVDRLDGEAPRKLPKRPGPPSSSEIRSNVEPERYLEMVKTAKEHIAAGDIIQVVLSQRLTRETRAHPMSIYRALRTINPSPYMYYLHLGDFDVVGASPELLVQVDDGLVQTHPIAGTRPRGIDDTQDRFYEEELRADEKERAEHVMLLDLGRNDIGRVARPGTVKVTQVMDVERYSHVMHLVSHVEGKLRAGMTQMDALRACFPAGTVSGAPKIRAMEIISDLEPDRRGAYAGSVGYFSFSGNLDTAITIRTILMKDGLASVQAGAGIVADSIPEMEYQECFNKARGMLRAIEVADDSEGEF
jgi:anthranilate synthase component 1